MHDGKGIGPRARVHMQSSRLSHGIKNRAVLLPDDGRIVVFRPRAGADLGALPKARIHVVQGFWPDYQAFCDAGFDTDVSATGDYSAAVIFLPRAKAQARALIAQASELVATGPVIVDGQKTDGIESIYKACRKRGADVGASYSKAHGKLFSMTGGDFADWAANCNETRLEGGFVTVPGIFSADGIDRGSAALARVLPEKLSGSVADLGAGWGYLSRQILQASKVTECHLIEAEHAALECARANIADPRAVFHWADATRLKLEGAMDVVVTNPPFHQGRAGEPALGQAFISAARTMLKPNGSLWLVANRHLPYEAALSDAFGEVSEIAGDPSFKVFLCSKPRRGAR